MIPAGGKFRSWLALARPGGAHSWSVGLRPRCVARGQQSLGGSAPHNTNVTSFLSEPEAPWLSVTLTVIV
jgi:hypothetical protein